MTREIWLAVSLAAVFAGMALPLRAENPVDVALQQLEICNTDDARQQLEQYLSKQPADGAALQALARTHLVSGNAEQAVKLLEQAVSAQPVSAESQFRLGQALAAHVNDVSVFSKPGVARRMRAAFTRAVELAPESVEYRGALLQWYAQAPGIVGGSLDKAREELAQIRKRDAAWGHYYEAMILTQEGHKADADAAIGRAAAAGVNEALNLRVPGLVEAEDWAALFSTFEAVVAKDPNQVAAWYGLGRTAAVSGQNLPRGEQALKNFLSNPRHRCQAGNLTAAAAHWRLGNVYERMGRKDEARGSYQAALAADPKFDDARKSLNALR